MPAALGAHLVFHVDCGRTGFDHRANGPRNVEGAAPAGIDIDQERQAGSICNPADIDQNVFHRADAQIRHAQRVGRHPATGQIECLEPRCLSKPGRICVDRPRHLERLLVPQRGAESLTSRYSIVSLLHAMPCAAS